MIEHLKGIHETVAYRDLSSIKLYDNIQFEEYPRHWHTCMEIILPTEGGYLLNCDGKGYEMQEGDLIFVFPGCLHHLLPCRGKRYIFQIELSEFSSSPEIAGLIERLYPACLITPKDRTLYPALLACMQEIVAEYHMAAPMYAAIILAKVLTMLTLLAREPSLLSQPSFAVSGSKQKEYLEKFTDVCDYISAHCCEQLTLDEVAGRAGFSKYHFSRLFKEFTNVSFYKYLNQKRIDHASQLLIDPELSITSVSLASGYASLSAFIRMFRIVKGCTPTEFRQMYDL